MKSNPRIQTLEQVILDKASHKCLSNQAIKQLNEILSILKNSSDDQRMATLTIARDFLGFVKSSFVEKQMVSLITQNLHTMEEVAIFKNNYSFR